MADGNAAGVVGVLGRIRVWLLGLVVIWIIVLSSGVNLSGDASKSGLVWCRQAGSIALYFVVVAILRTLWPMRVTRSDPYKLIAGGKTHRVHTFTGQTHSASVSHISTTTGTGSISSTSPGNVYGRVDISTRVDRLDRFSLTNAGGGQHTVEVKNAGVPVGDGQYLTAAWAIPRGSRSGRYVAFVNHSTGVTTWPRTELARTAMGANPGVSVLWAFAAGILLTLGGSSLGIVAFFVCLLCLGIVSRLQARLFAGITAGPLIGSIKADGAAALAVAGNGGGTTATTATFVAAASTFTEPATWTPNGPTGGSSAPPPPPPPAAPPPQVPAGWHADPHHRHEHRYWDGSRWTDHVSDAGVPSQDPS